MSHKNMGTILCPKRHFQGTGRLCNKKQSLAYRIPDKSHCRIKYEENNSTAPASYI
jgi:hypothetical protein